MKKAHDITRVSATRARGVLYSTECSARPYAVTNDRGQGAAIMVFVDSFDIDARLTKLA